MNDFQVSPKSKHLSNSILHSEDSLEQKYQFFFMKSTLNNVLESPHIDNIPRLGMEWSVRSTVDTTLYLRRHYSWRHTIARPGTKSSGLLKWHFLGNSYAYIPPLFLVLTYLNIHIFRHSLMGTQTHMHAYTLAYTHIGITPKVFFKNQIWCCESRLSQMPARQTTLLAVLFLQPYFLKCFKVNFH